MGSNSHRLGRINSELQNEIAQVINYELKNVKGIVSVTRVNITPDLRYAKVYVSILDNKNAGKTMEALKKSSKFIRGRIANTINLRITPELVFEYDDSELQGERIDQILRDIKKQDAKFKKNDEE